MKRYVLTLAMLLPALSSAQAVWKVAFRFQPTMLAPAGLVTSCGIRFLGMGTESRLNNEVDVVDGSIAIHKAGIATVKAGYMIGDLSNPASAKTRATGKNISWVRVGEGAPLTASKTMAAEDPGYMIYSTSIDAGLTGLTSMLEGKPISLSFQNGTGPASIFNGAAIVDDETRQQFLSCVDTFLKDAKTK